MQRPGPRARPDRSIWEPATSQLLSKENHVADAITVSGEISGTDKSITFETGKLAQQSQGAVVARIGRSSVTLQQGLYLDGVCFAASQAVIVVLDAETRQPIALPAALRAGFAALTSIEEVAA